MCYVLTDELDRARRVCEAIGLGTRSTELWTAVVSLSDTWTEVEWLNAQLASEAESVGITGEQWRVIRDGR